MTHRDRVVAPWYLWRNFRNWDRIGQSWLAFTPPMRVFLSVTGRERAAAKAARLRGPGVSRYWGDGFC